MRDEILRVMLGRNEAVAYLTRTGNIVSQARDVHSLSNVAAAALGRALTACAIMGEMQKNEKLSLTLTLSGGGPLGRVVVLYESGLVKGYVDHPEVELPLTPEGKLDVGGAVGRDGRLILVRDLGMKEPYVGQVRLRTGEVAEDLAWYFAVSEQQPSLVSLGVRLNGDGEVSSAGGIIIQPLPGCSEELLSQMELRSPLMESVSTLLQDGDSLETIAGRLFGGIEWSAISCAEPKWGCGCSRERIERVLLSMGAQEMRKLIEENEPTEVCCHFCRAAYLFSPEELSGLLNSAEN